MANTSLEVGRLSRACEPKRPSSVVVRPILVAPPSTIADGERPPPDSARAAEKTAAGPWNSRK